MNEIDQAAFIATAEWCVYLHSRPDGSVFYVGKGRRRRAFDFAPSRRTQHHKNIVAKYGRENIGVRVIPCAHEVEANWLERAHIAMWRLNGAQLVNLTDGGEGVSGRAVSQKQSAALSMGRGKIAFERMPEESKCNVMEGLARGREKASGWRNSQAGRAHLLKLALCGALALHQDRNVVCAQCGEGFITRSAKAKCCGRVCEQRYRRARQAH